MDFLVDFFKTYGLELTLIAVAGVLILGILKYCNLFKKIEETYRHYIYLGISVGLSLLGSVIYLAANNSLEPKIFFTLATAIFAVNQSAYTTFKILPIKEWFVRFLDTIVGFFKKDTGTDKEE